MSQHSVPGVRIGEEASPAGALDVELQRLVDVREHLSTAACWIWNEWGERSGLSLETVTDRLLGSEQCPPTLLAVRGSTPVGVVGFRRFQRANDQHESLFIDVMFVEPSFRGRGVGSALLRSAFTRGCAFGRELFAYTDKREWYERQGWSFVQDGRDANHVVLVRRP